MERLKCIQLTAEQKALLDEWDTISDYRKAKKMLAITGVKSTSKELFICHCKGYKVKNACQAHIVLHFDELLKMDVNCKSNNKLGNVPCISFASINAVNDFLYVVDTFPELLETLPPNIRAMVVKGIAFFRTNKICKNCAHCMGVCYVTKEYYRFPLPAIQHIRNVILYLCRLSLFDSIILAKTSNALYTRFMESGDFFDMACLQHFSELTDRMTGFTYGYTKQYELLKTAVISPKMNVNISDMGCNINTLEVPNWLLDIRDTFGENNHCRPNIFKSVSTPVMDVVKSEKITSWHDMPIVICPGKCENCSYCKTAKNLLILCEIH